MALSSVLSLPPTISSFALWSSLGMKPEGFDENLGHGLPRPAAAAVSPCGPFTPAHHLLCPWNMSLLAEAPACSVSCCTRGQPAVAAHRAGAVWQCGSVATDNLGIPTELPCKQQGVRRLYHSNVSSQCVLTGVCGVGGPGSWGLMYGQGPRVHVRGPGLDGEASAVPSIGEAARAVVRSGWSRLGARKGSDFKERRTGAVRGSQRWP